MSACYLLRVGLVPACQGSVPLSCVPSRLPKSDRLHAFPCRKAACENISPFWQDSQNSHGCGPVQVLNSANVHTFPWGKHDFPEIASLLRRLGESKDLPRGKEVHAFLKRRGYDYNTYIGNCLVQMYGNCGSVEDARAAFDVIHSPNLHSHNILIQVYAVNGHFKDASSVFESMSKRNVVSWTTIISSAAQQGSDGEATMLFHRMEGEGIAPNLVTIISVLEECTAREEGCKIHCSLVLRGFEADTVAATALITMYGRCGSLANARYVFSTMPKRNVVSWGAIITALTENGRPEESLEVFVQMNKHPVVHDKVIYICALHACASYGALEQGQNIHAKMIEEGIERDTIVANALVTLYGRSGNLDSAMTIFRKIIKRDAVSWSAIISACAQNGDSKEALKLFNQMELEGFQSHIATHISVLDACSDIMALEKGREVHLAVVKNGSELDTITGNSLVNLYSKCGGLADAQSAFLGLQKRDVISWNNMISACAQRGHGIDSLGYFHQMLNEGIKPNKMTFTFVTEACNSIEEGRQRDAAISSGERHVMAATSLIPMFLRWSCIDEARLADKSMLEENVVASSAMVDACTKNHGLPEVLDVQYQVQCGRIKFVMGHHTGIIDILSRAGYLSQAEDLLRSVPNATLSIPWLSLLCSCRLHGDILRGKHASDKCFQMDPGNASPYSELTQLCSSSGRMWGGI